jgi:hypothetical protein
MPLVSLLDSNVTALIGSHASHGAAQAVIHSHVTSQGTVIVNVHSVDIAMYIFSTSTTSITSGHRHANNGNTNLKTNTRPRLLLVFNRNSTTWHERLGDYGGHAVVTTRI